MDAFHKQHTMPGISIKQKGSIPKQIGPYAVEKLLNRGGMGVLYLGVHPETRRPVAIKVLSPKFVEYPEAVERFLQEAHIIALTSHPHIVAIYGEGVWEGGVYIAMELIDGIPLSQFIVQKSCSLKRAVEILLQIASALAHLHAQGIIHRDLKPENILIAKDGSIKVIDFGIAQLHKSSSSQTFMGTPSYTSPEQRAKTCEVSSASDMYSLGVIAYELLLGKLSFGAIDLSLLPKGIRPLIEKALAFSLKERYVQVVDFIVDLRTYLSSPDFEKDRSQNDCAREMTESLQEIHLQLFYPRIPYWPEVEIGCATQKNADAWGIYCDFFKYPDQKKLILIAEASSLGVKAPMYIALFKGLAYGLLHGTAAPELPTLLSRLDGLVKEALQAKTISLQCLLLDFTNDLLTYAACGCGGLLRLSDGARVAHPVHVENPSLGDPLAGTFAHAIDNWSSGDRVILHSMPTSTALESSLIEELDHSLYLSCQGQADTLFKRLPGHTTHKHQKILLSLHRID